MSENRAKGRTSPARGLLAAPEVYPQDYIQRVALLLQGDELVQHLHDGEVAEAEKRFRALLLDEPQPDRDRLFRLRVLYDEHKGHAAQATRKRQLGALGTRAAGG